MSAIESIRPTEVDHVFFVTVDGKEMLATAAGAGDEEALVYEEQAYRLWSPSTSKLASMVTRGMKMPIHEKSRILYLGAASGTTVSHVSDIVTGGIVYAVEFAPRPMRDLLGAISERSNVIPIMADARSPDAYPPYIDHVDCIYQDVAQPNQSEIAIANADKYLINGGWLILAIKGRSISVSEQIEDVLKEEVDRLKTRFEVVEQISLEPLHHDHVAVLCKYIQ